MLVIPYPDKPHFWLYGFPMKVYEYMASQRPIVYSKLELAEEVFVRLRLRLYSRRPERFGGKIKQAIDAKDSDEKIKIAYEKVRNYTWQKRLKRLLSF